MGQHYGVRFEGLVEVGGSVEIPPRGGEQSPKKSVDWIVPPGLMGDLHLFAAHYAAAKGEPILIVGPTGVGKNLFKEFLKALYRERDKAGPIVEVNCSHFNENLARSELFGHIKGAFTGAYRDNPGYVSTANKGLLILEEIGELPKEVQAMLLTFVETGQYRRVGETKIQEGVSNVQIVGLTNNVGNLRQDFLERFLDFPVRPLYLRRQDILYYLYAKFPDLVKSLGHWDVLALISHNWPGNVREIERVGTLLTRGDISQLEDKRDGFKVYRLNPPREFSTTFSSPQEDFYWALQRKMGAKVKLLESLLNRYRVGTAAYSRRLAFSDFEKHKRIFGPEAEEYQERFGIHLTGSFEPFEEAFAGFLLFCALFYQDPKLDGYILELKKCTNPLSWLEVPEYRHYELIQTDEKFWSSAHKLRTPIFEYLSGVKLPKGVEIPEDDDLGRELERIELFFDDFLQKHPSNPFFSQGDDEHTRQENLKDNEPLPIVKTKK